MALLSLCFNAVLLLLLVRVGCGDITSHIHTCLDFSQDILKLDKCFICLKLVGACYLQCLFVENTCKYIVILNVGVNCTNIQQWFLITVLYSSQKGGKLKDLIFCCIHNAGSKQNIVYKYVLWSNYSHVARLGQKYLSSSGEQRS